MLMKSPQRGQQKDSIFSKNLGQAPTLNIAGPRESMHKDAYCYTRKVISLFFKMIEANDD